MTNEPEQPMHVQSEHKPSKGRYTPKRLRAGEKPRQRSVTQENLRQEALQEDSESQLQAGPKAQRKGKKGSRLLAAFFSLIIKLMIVTILVFILLNYVFGLTRNLSLNMQPAVQDGDLILYFRLVDLYDADDVVVVNYQDKVILSRVVAVSGDTVDIAENGLIINGSYVQEPKVMGETTQFENGVTFPLVVPAGKAFVLGDNREHATDSRIFGCVDMNDIYGRVVGLFRRRNF